MDPTTILPSLRKKRSHMKGLITKQGNRIHELESVEPSPESARTAYELQKRIKGLDEDFRKLHFEILDCIEEEDDSALEREQEMFYSYDEQVQLYFSEIGTLIQERASQDEKPMKVMYHKLRKLKSKTTITQESIGEGRSIDLGLLKSVSEELDDYRRTLHDLENELFTMDLPESHELFKLHEEADTIRLACLRRRHELEGGLSSRNTEPINGACKLKKLDIPTFKGSVTEWHQFWERFEQTVHESRTLTTAEKWEYLHQALMDGPALETIAGFSKSDGQYEEAIRFLKEKYHRPREVIKHHVLSIMDYPVVREGDAKGLQRLHSTWTQHIRALEELGHPQEPALLTCMLETKLDKPTLAKWKWESRSDITDTPVVNDLLLFIKDQASAMETQMPDKRRQTLPVSDKRPRHGVKPVQSFAVSMNPTLPKCIACSDGRHPLYACETFRSLPVEEKKSILRQRDSCFNCLRSGHTALKCNSSHRCKRCQKLHHTLLHIERGPNSGSQPSATQSDEVSISSNTASTMGKNIVYMTCKILVSGPDGTSTTARALLDTGSGASFITERLSRTIKLPRTSKNIKICGISGQTIKHSNTPSVQFKASPIACSGKTLDVSALVLDKVTRDLPTESIAQDRSWKHLKGLPLADPTFMTPGRIDIILGAEIFPDIMRHGRRQGPRGSPTAWETEFGWVLSGTTHSFSNDTQAVAVHHAITSPVLDTIRKFWEIEETSRKDYLLSTEERSVVEHFKQNCSRDEEGRFIIPLPRKPDVAHIGESRTQAIRRFTSVERSLRSKGKFFDVDTVIKEYMELGHAEKVPNADLNKDVSEVYYMPVHVVYKPTSTSTKTRAVFDASAASSTGVSLNNTLMVGPTVHPSLLEVLVRFRTHRVAITADVSKMYRAIRLTDTDKDLHRFVWRSDSKQPITDFRMTRITFGVAASCYAANMAVRQNAIQHEHQFPRAAQAVKEAFYVDDGLTGADSTQEAIRTREELQQLFLKGHFSLKKWNSSDPAVLKSIPAELRDSEEVLCISGTEHRSTTTLGVKWDSHSDVFHVNISKPLRENAITKHQLLSDISKVFDIIGWYAPSTILMKMLLQTVWESGVEWDEAVGDDVMDTWRSWRKELHLLAEHPIPRCYYPKNKQITHRELHGFSDASEKAYAGVIYLRMTDLDGHHHIQMVMAKTKVAPIRRISIPRLELCGAVIATRLIEQAREVLSIPLEDVHMWTDSTVVLAWLTCCQRKLNTYVANRITEITDSIPPGRWKHVRTRENPADCASRGILPSELIAHHLWWKGPPWLQLDQTNWPQKENTTNELAMEEIVTYISIPEVLTEPVISPTKFSSYQRLIRTISWIQRFLHNCRHPDKKISNPHLTVEELGEAEDYMLRQVQQGDFPTEIRLLRTGQNLTKGNRLLPLHPYLDGKGILRVKGRLEHSELPEDTKHPIILSATHHVSKLLIRAEHHRLLHAGPTLTLTSLSGRFHMIGGRRTIRSILRQCVLCRQKNARSLKQKMGQLPPERVHPGAVFSKVCLDYTLDHFS